MNVGIGVGVILLARISGTPGTAKLNGPGQLIKIAVGGGATIIGLMIMAEVAPEVALMLAWLILIGALLAYGVDFARALMNGTLNPVVPSGLPKGIGRADPDNLKNRRRPL